jgi:hypothetical protein
MKAFFAFLIAVCAALPAFAGDATFSSNGIVAKVTTPDDWPASGGEGKPLVVKLPDDSAEVTLALVGSQYGPEKLSSDFLDSMHSQLVQSSTATVSGHDAFVYRSTHTADDGTQVDFSLTVVPIDRISTLVCIVTSSKLSPDRQSALDAAVASLAIVTP